MRKLTISVFNINSKLNFKKSINLPVEFFDFSSQDRKRFKNIDDKILSMAQDEARGCAFHHEIA